MADLKVNLPEKKNDSSNKKFFDISLDTPIIYTNQIIIYSVSNEEVEIGICIKGPNGDKSKVLQRLITTTPHFLRMAKLFSQVEKDILAQIDSKTKP